MDYEVNIAESSKTLTKKEQLVVLDMKLAGKLDDLVKAGPVSWEPDYHVVLAIHNENARGAQANPALKDYTKTVFVAKDGSRYITGSKSFVEGYQRVTELMAGSTEPYKVVCCGLDSKNYPGKQYLACGIE